MSPLFIMLVTAVLTVVLGYPLKARRIPPNWFYGFRTPATMKNPDLWYEVNQKTGKDLMVIGGVLFVLAASLGAMNVKPVPFAGACMGWIALGTSLMVARGLMFIQQEQRKARKGEGL